MSCSRRAALGSEASKNAIRGHRGPAHKWRFLLAGWRIHVRRGAKTAVGKEDSCRREKQDSARGKFVVGAGGGEKYFNGDGQRNEVGHEIAQHLRVCGRRSLLGFAGEGGSEAGRD